MDYWSRSWTDFHETLSRCFGPNVKRGVTLEHKPALTWLLLNQMIFTFQGAGFKMISLFMTITWLAGVDRIFIFPPAYGAFIQMGHRLQSSFNCSKAVISDMSRKFRACQACQRNGRLTCRRYSVCVCFGRVGFGRLSADVLFQDQAGGAVFEDIPGGV